ncbi:hypothetical protein J6590_075145 [Homalodisca vitripennis]|nr:hypothetical protein J6590_075145 [Homalodisca vitripennis]
MNSNSERRYNICVESRGELLEQAGGAVAGGSMFFTLPFTCQAYRSVTRDSLSLLPHHHRGVNISLAFYFFRSPRSGMEPFEPMDAARLRLQEPIGRENRPSRLTDTRPPVASTTVRCPLGGFVTYSHAPIPSTFTTVSNCAPQKTVTPDFALFVFLCSEFYISLTKIVSQSPYRAESVISSGRCYKLYVITIGRSAIVYIVYRISVKSPYRAESVISSGRCYKLYVITIGRSAIVYIVYRISVKSPYRAESVISSGRCYKLYVITIGRSAIVYIVYRISVKSPYRAKSVISSGRCYKLYVITIGRSAIVYIVYRISVKSPYRAESVISSGRC